MDAGRRHWLAGNKWGGLLIRSLASHQELPWRPVQNAIRSIRIAVACSFVVALSSTGASAFPYQQSSADRFNEGELHSFDTHARFEVLTARRIETLAGVEELAHAEPAIGAADNAGDTLDFWEESKPVRWSEAFDLMPMWGGPEGPRLLVGVNVLLAGSRYRVFTEYSPDSFHADPWRRPERKAGSGKFLRGYGEQLGQVFFRDSEGKSGQGTLITKFIDQESSSDLVPLVVDCFQIWLPGRRTFEVEVPNRISVVPTLFDSFALLGASDTEVTVGMLGFDDSAETLGVNFLAGAGREFWPLTLPNAQPFNLAGRELAKCHASMELGRTAGGELFVVGFLSTETFFYTFRFDPRDRSEVIKLEPHANLKPYPAHIIGNALNQGGGPSDDRFYLVRESSEPVFLNNPNEVAPSWNVFEFQSEPGQPLGLVSLNVGSKEYDPGDMLYGSTEALGLASCSGGGLGGIATIRCASERQRLLTLGLGGSKGNRSADLRRLRIDPFNRAIFSAEHSLLWRVLEGKYLMISPSSTSFFQTDLGIPPAGSISIATVDELQLGDHGGSFLRPLEVYSLEANEFQAIDGTPFE